MDKNERERLIIALAAIGLIALLTRAFGPSVDCVHYRTFGETRLLSLTGSPVPKNLRS
jgi:hypothetical protein